MQSLRVGALVLLRDGATPRGVGQHGRHKTASPAALSASPISSSCRRIHGALRFVCASNVGICAVLRIYGVSRKLFECICVYNAPKTLCVFCVPSRRASKHDQSKHRHVYKIYIALVVDGCMHVQGSPNPPWNGLHSPTHTHTYIARTKPSAEASRRTAFILSPRPPAWICVGLSGTLLMLCRLCRYDVL